MPGDGPGRYLLAPEVVGGREVGLPPLLPELGHVGARLLPRAVRSEVSPQHVLEGPAHDALAGVATAVIGLGAYAAADADPVHGLEHGLAGDDGAVFRAQAHGHLSVDASVRGTGEDLDYPVPWVRPDRRLGVRQGVAVGLAPLLQRRLRRYAELGHGVGDGHAPVGDGARRRDLLALRVSP